MKTNADTAFQVMPRKGITLKGKAPIQKAYEDQAAFDQGVVSIAFFLNDPRFFDQSFPAASMPETSHNLIFAKTFSKPFL